MMMMVVMMMMMMMMEMKVRSVSSQCPESLVHLVEGRSEIKETDCRAELGLDSQNRSN